jgi:hypothetical protein
MANSIGTKTNTKNEIKHEIETDTINAVCDLNIVSILADENHKIGDHKENVVLTEEQEAMKEHHESVNNGSGEEEADDDLLESKGDFTGLSWQEHCKKLAGEDTELSDLIEKISEQGYWQEGKLSEEQSKKLNELGEMANIIGLGSRNIRECWLANLKYHYSNNEFEKSFYERMKGYLGNKQAFDPFENSKGDHKINNWAVALDIKERNLKTFKDDCAELYLWVDAPPKKDLYTEDKKIAIIFTQRKNDNWRSVINLKNEDLEDIITDLDFSSIAEKDRRDAQVLIEEIFDNKYSLFEKVRDELLALLKNGKDKTKLRSSVLRKFCNQIEKWIDQKPKTKGYQNTWNKRIEKYKENHGEVLFDEFVGQKIQLNYEESGASYVSFRDLILKQ